MSRQKSQSPTKAQKKVPRVWPAFALIVLFMASLVALYIITNRAPSKRASAGAKQGTTQAPRPTPRMTEQALKDTFWDPAWPPLPSAATPAQPIDQVRAMYAFAARHPEVLQYAPCYCGCEAQGHKSARDCFVKGRTADGKPQWDGMGFT